MWNMFDLEVSKELLRAHTRLLRDFDDFVYFVIQRWH